MGKFRDAMADDEAETGIDMSPLIDCVFILLIFFIVTTVFVDETGIQVDKPPAASAAKLEKTSILIALTADGRVYYDNRDIGAAGVQAVVRRILQTEDLPVIIQADKGSKTGDLARVYDEARLAGATKISLATAGG